MATSSSRRRRPHPAHEHVELMGRPGGWRPAPAQPKAGPQSVSQRDRRGEAAPHRLKSRSDFSRAEFREAKFGRARGRCPRAHEASQILMSDTQRVLKPAAEGGHSEPARGCKPRARERSSLEAVGLGPRESQNEPPEGRRVPAPAAEGRTRRYPSNEGEAASRAVTYNLTARDLWERAATRVQRGRRPSGEGPEEQSAPGTLARPQAREPRFRRKAKPGQLPCANLTRRVRHAASFGWGIQNSLRI